MFYPLENMCLVILIYFTVTEKIRYVQSLVSDLISPSVIGCFKSSLSKIIFEQTGFLQNILHEYQKANNQYLTKSFLRQKRLKAVNINQIALVVSAFGLSLEARVCLHKTQSEITTDQRYIGNSILDKETDDEFKKIVLQRKQPQCNCKNQFCHNCSNACKHICWQSYILSQWSCESIQGTDFIPLNSLCDGKFDCYDKTDEENCSNVTSGKL